MKPLINPLHNKIPPPKFEDYLPIIDAEIAKRRHKWNLTSITWMDYDDVAQIIRIHIYRKWNQYQPTRPLAPWLNSIITNQIRNLIRNHYSNYARPCLKCGAATDNNGCSIYGTQCDNCPLYAYWQKRKQPATQIKIPVSIENHPHEVKSIFDDSSDVSRHVEAVHSKMKEILKPLEWQVYEGLFITGKDEGEVARELGYTSNEKGRDPGYKQIKNIRKAIIVKVKKCLDNGEIDII
jgi:hypothetical protein